jgi:Fe2+ transport system protein FeoA
MEFEPASVQSIPLSDLSLGLQAVIESISLSEAALDRVMLFGFMPGVVVAAGPAGPGGDPRVYHLDGTDVAVRRETARHILVRPLDVEEQG